MINIEIEVSKIKVSSDKIKSAKIAKLLPHQVIVSWRGITKHSTKKLSDKFSSQESFMTFDSWIYRNTSASEKKTQNNFKSLPLVGDTI